MITIAIFHFDVGYFSRRRGQSIVSAAAYRSGERLYDHYYGEMHDFMAKGGIVYTMLLLTPDAPYSDRETFWNAAEHAEKYRNARLAREVEVALPRELSLHDNIQLVERYAKVNFVERGICADVSIHDKGDGNPHAHILLATREVGPYGFNPKKNRDWDKRENVQIWRREWANALNRKLERRGLELVSHESYAVQDFARVTERVPTLHLGHRIRILERYGETDRGNEYRAIVELNREREALKHQHDRARHRGRTR